MHTLASAYPADAIGGGDFLTLAAQRKIIDVDEHGTEIVRPERIIITDRLYTGEEFVTGRPCFSEQTVRAMGALVGLYDAPAVRKLEREIGRLTSRLDQSEGARMDLLKQIEAQENTAAVRRIYVAVDGTEFPSLEALREHVGFVPTHTPDTVTTHQEA